MNLRSLKIHVHQVMRHKRIAFLCHRTHVASYTTLSVTDGTVTDAVFRVCSSERFALNSRFCFHKQQYPRKQVTFEQ